MYFIFNKLNSTAFYLPFLSLGSVLLLSIFSFCNWGLEIKKWHLLTNYLTTTSLMQALKQHFIGQALGFITPNKIGEYGAKGTFYPKKQRPEIWMLNFVGNAHQMTITILFGILGLLLSNLALLENFMFFLFASTLALGALIFIALKFKQHKYVLILKSIPKKLHLKTFALSVMRYLIFSLQYYYILKVLGITIPEKIIFINTWLYYFISSCVPSFALTDAIVKSSVAISLFGLYNAPPLLIIAASTTMWLLNFVLPTCIGCFYLLTLKKSPDGILYN